MKKLGIVGFVAIALAVILIGGTVAVVAQSPTATPTPKGPVEARDKPMGHSRGGLGQEGLEAAAEVLGMTSEDLSAQLEGGQTLADLAEKADVELQAVRGAVDAANEAAKRESVEQAVEDGELSREQADWLLEGMDSGYTPAYGPRGAGKGGFGQEELDAVAKALNMTSEQLSTQLWGGRTLADLAERAGVKLEDVQAAAEAAQKTAMRDSIEQAVEDGDLTREQADWLLEGLENGYIPQMRGGFGPGGRGGHMEDGGAGFGGLQFQSAPGRSGTGIAVGSST